MQSSWLSPEETKELGQGNECSHNEKIAKKTKQEQSSLCLLHYTCSLVTFHSGSGEQLLYSDLNCCFFLKTHALECCNATVQHLWTRACFLLVVEKISPQVFLEPYVSVLCALMSVGLLLFFFFFFESITNN